MPRTKQTAKKSTGGKVPRKGATSTAPLPVQPEVPSRHKSDTEFAAADAVSLKPVAKTFPERMQGVLTDQVSVH